jgi:putative glutamine amidotransferase
MTKPLIGLTTYQSANAENLPASSLLQAYSDAILSVGGLPVLIPLSFVDKPAELANLVELMDGLVFTGGGDIDPQRYGGTDHELSTGVDSGRDSLELLLFELLVERRKPLLGICRGMQLMNVALGGDLYTDLSTQRPGSLKHDHDPDRPRTHIAHGVTLSAEGKLFQIIEDKTIPVNSLHHQGIHRLASGMLVQGLAEDGSIEAVELVDYPFCIGVQWHPEWLMDQNASRKIFKALVDSAGGDHG